MPDANWSAQATPGAWSEDSHPIDEILLKSYALGWRDGADGVHERDVTGLVMEGREAAARCAGAEAREGVLDGPR